MEASLAQPQQDRSANSSGGTRANGGRGGIICHSCQGAGHKRGDPECPNAGKPRHGLDEEQSEQINDLAKLNLELMPPCAFCKDDDKFNVSLSGNVVAKCCRHCGRFTKGSTAHCTCEHTGTQNLFPHQGSANGAPAPAPAPAPAAPTPASAPASANLAAFPSGLDLLSVPVVDNGAHTSITNGLAAFSGPTPDCDFGGMTAFDVNIAAADPSDWAFLEMPGSKGFRGWDLLHLAH